MKMDENMHKTLYCNCKLDLAYVQVVPVSQHVLRYFELYIRILKFASSRQWQWITFAVFITNVWIPVEEKLWFIPLAKRFSVIYVIGYT